MNAEEQFIEAELELRYTSELKDRGIIRDSTVYGFVCPEKGFLHSIVYDRSSATWVESQEKVQIYLAKIMERVVTSTKRFNVVYGGRGSGKSIGVGDIVLGDNRDNGHKTYCLREYQSSIRNSVHSLLKEEIERLEFTGFEVLNHAISNNEKAAFEFAGLARSTDSIKSAHGFTNFWMEESQTTSADSLRALTPTVRAKPNKGLPVQFKPKDEEPSLKEEISDILSSTAPVKMYFVANPGSSEDPFSKRFLMPYMSELESNGIFEDTLHLILRVNYTDNPWFGESGLEDERLWDEANLPQAMYDHVWLGHFNDSVDSALVMAEWFDACVDSHIRLGWEPRGAKVASHDPSDRGPDSKGYAMRHGSVVMDIQEKIDGDVNEGGHWAANLAIEHGVDAFSWDGNGMGAGLGEQMAKDFSGKAVQLSVFNAAESPDNPDSIYKPSLANPVHHQQKIKDTFRNKRGQYAWEFRDRIYRTYRWVVFGEFADPDLCISFSSDIALLPKLRAETCRLPIKPNSNGLNELYTKQEMKGSRFRITSPNLFDSAMQTFRHIPAYNHTNVYIPRPIHPIRMR